MITFEAGLDGVTFQSKGCKLLGGFYRAAGAGRRPTTLLLHGVPGVEKNLDVAYALRDAGWNCLYFHYRGCWGSEGSYSLAGLVDDLAAATEWVLSQPSVDVDRLALVGHSGGGYLALTGAALEPRFKAIVALCPLITPLSAPISMETWHEFAGMLHGVTGEELKTQYEALHPVTSKAEQLRTRSILMLSGALDDIFSPAHYPPLLAAVPAIEWHEFRDGDHALSSCRAEAVRRTVDWLVAHLGE